MRRYLKNGPQDIIATNMADKRSFGKPRRKVAKPIHLRMLEKSLELTSFLNYAKYRITQPIVEEPASESEEIDVEEDEPAMEELKIDRSIYFNLSHVGEDRRWLQDVMVADDSAPDDCDDENIVTEKDLRRMLKQHLFEKKYRKQYRSNPKYLRYKYYGASLLSKFDMYAENEKHMLSKKKEKDTKKVVIRKITKKNNMIKHVETIHELDDSLHDENEWEDGMTLIREDEDEVVHKIGRGNAVPGKTGGRRAAASSTPEAMAMRRRKLWILMCKKEMGKVQRAKANNHKEQLQACKRTAQLCMKFCRQKAMQSQKNMKETVWRSKRLTREMQSYWKRYDRVEREMRKRLEKEAEEQRKMDVEMIEAKRQQRKLNFLITQTELYAHFMSRKLGTASPAEQLRILSQLDEKKITRLAPIDDYDCEVMKAQAKKNVIEAIESDRARTKQFDRQSDLNGIKSEVDVDVDDLDLTDVTINVEEEHPQPNLFKGHLKGYQLKGMNWLANLYDQGISGILADEMGLGKTVQSIAFLCHVAEKYSVWGPFLVISPASTLHNWQQEMARFVPDFRVVPYWGNPNERKILRQFWEQKDLHTKEASFHVVITSYQIIITDFKYFNRIKWQYMILDEAQAIKSSSSVRWKMLLGFSCRNRLLLSGTPIQNSMAELWALLHFIMPTLFDSHDEFNEWFSKDIENHVENKTGIDEKHLSRLHMILKPFMLRRIKKDVENELSDKIEVMVYCPLTRRQKLLYMALKKKIRIEDLLHYTVGGGDTNSIDKNFTSNLMNLVMQFRKVCNHPELFERRDAKSPLHIKMTDYVVPQLLYNSVNSTRKLRILFNQFSIWAVEYIQRCHSGCFSFGRLTNKSPAELNLIFTQGIAQLFELYTASLGMLLKLHHRFYWWDQNIRTDTYNCLNLIPRRKVGFAEVYNSRTLTEIVFTRPLETESRIYIHTEHIHHRMAETTEHRIIRERIISKDIKDHINGIVIHSGTVETPFIESPPYVYSDLPTDLPLFLSSYSPKVSSRSLQLYASSHQCAKNQMQNNLRITEIEPSKNNSVTPVQCRVIKCLRRSSNVRGWFNIVVPDKETLVTDAGKLSVLDPLLKRLKREGHRVLIYSQMTKMIDLLEEYMWHRKHKYMRLDGSSKISERRDMVADFQARTDIFVFLLSTRAGGLGINLTAADTVIFYDSDWNPTVDQQAMDRAHRLGQTKQVTVYRLICKGTIEERILQRAREKSEIQRMVISGGNFKPDTLKPKEVVSLLLDDEEIETKYRQKAEERKNQEELREKKERDRKRKQLILSNPYIIDDMDDAVPNKRMKEESGLGIEPADNTEIGSPVQEESSTSVLANGHDDSSNDALLDIETPLYSSQPAQFSPPYSSRQRVVRGGARRGRPRGSRRGGGSGSKGRESIPSMVDDNGTSNGTETILMVDDKGETKAVPIRRGPGRPRLKPVGPANQGTRGVLRPRKPVRALPVPLRSQSLAAALHNGSTINKHLQPSCFQFYNSPNPSS